MRRKDRERQDGIHSSLHSLVSQQVEEMTRDGQWHPSYNLYIFSISFPFTSFSFLIFSQILVTFGWGMKWRRDEDNCPREENESLSFSFLNLILMVYFLFPSPTLWRGKGRRKDKYHITHKCCSFPNLVCEEIVNERIWDRKWLTVPSLPSPISARAEICVTISLTS